MAKGKDLFQDLEITQDNKFSLPGSTMHFAADDDADDVQDTEPTDDDAADDEVAATADNDAEDDASASNGDGDEQEEFSYEPLFQDLIAEGILFDKPEGEEGFDDTPEGFRAAVQYARDQEVQRYISELPQTAQRIMSLALKGATEEDVQALISLEDGPDWEAADLDDEDVQAAAVEELMRLRDEDITEEEIAEKLEDLRDLGKLQKEAEKAKKVLVKHQETQKKEVEAAVAEREKQAAARYEQEVKVVSDYVDEVKEIGGYKLTKKDRDGFKEYLFKKDKEGKTAAEKNNTAERRIQKEFLNYKNFNFTTVEQKATTEITQNVKKQLARYKGQSSASQPVRVEKQPEGLIGKIMLPGRG